MNTQPVYRKFKLYCHYVWLCLVLANQSVAAQTAALDSLTVGAVKVFYSAGHQPRAKDVAVRMDRATRFGAKLTGFRPEVSVYVLSTDDWSTYTSFPVYGMPHYTDAKKLIVASSDNEYWQSFLPPLERLEPALAEKVRATYSQNGKLTMQPFFDLLAIHELGHAFHIQGGLTTQRQWMGEFFCNLMLHTYIADNEPGLLDALTVFPEMVVSMGTQNFTFTTLDQLEKNYELIGMQHPRNYGWYQCRLHVAAGKVYDAGGKEPLIRLWKTLKESTKPLTDEQFADVLKNNVHPSVAAIITGW